MSSRRSAFAVLCLLLVVSLGASEADPLVGCWYLGDGFGVNMTLTLEADGDYTLLWTGCVGVYGTAEGTWRSTSDTVVLDPTKESGSLEEQPIRLLVVIRKEGETRLAEKDRADEVRKSKAEPHTAFRKTECVK